MNVPQLIPYGDAALLVKYEVSGYSEQVSLAVQALCKSLSSNKYWDEIVPGYDSVLVSFDQTKLTMDQAHRKIKNKINKLDMSKVKPGSVLEIPVHYGGANGPDMGNIAASSGLSEDEIIRLHSAQTYVVCMMGFVPGFAFLSQAPIALHHPRHKQPRLSVPAGSVGIAGWQTGIYGLETPGGWQIIGRTPLTMFDSKRQDPFLLKAGDQVRFVPFDEGVSK